MHYMTHSAHYNFNTVCNAGCVMKKFKIPKVPVSATKSVRFPVDVIEQVEAAIRGKDCTFTAFVVEAVRVALENLEEDGAAEGEDHP